MFRTTPAVQADSAKAIFTLPENTAAIQIFLDSSGGIRLGTLIQLPGGASVEVTGDGFDEHTKRIACEGSSYYVFMEQDQTLPRRARAQSAG